MKKIVSFGDSFIFGSELANNLDGSQAWPGLAAKKLGAEYTTCAVPGCGNEDIARQVYSYFSQNSRENTLAVINWTWCPRWDFYLKDSNKWITLGATCVPSKLEQYVDNPTAQNMIDFYQEHAGTSTLWNKWRSLQAVWGVQQYLNQIGVCNVQTYMDSEMLDQQWHAPDYVHVLQELVAPELQQFDGQNFLDWSHKHGYAVTAHGLHPLEDAHHAAAEYWIDIYK
jgi:hypothetical protein